MATVTMAYKRAIVEERYPSAKNMPDHQVSAIYNRLISKPSPDSRVAKPSYKGEDKK